MVQTRAQGRREQSSHLPAPLGVNSPRRYGNQLQAGVGRGGAGGSASVDVTGDKVQGGISSSEARGTYIEYRRGGRGIPYTSPAGLSGNRRIRRNEEKKPTKCGHKQCKTCEIYNEDDVIRSFSTGKTERIINERNSNLNCGIDNVVYLLECDKCGVQYVGETSQKLNHRFSGHKSCIRNNTSKDKKETFLVKHFNEGACAQARYTCRIIQTINLPAKKNGKLDLDTNRYRRKQEDMWITNLQTLYPYGLNNRLGKNMDQREDDAVKVVLQPRRRKRKRKRRFRPRKENVKGDGVGVFSDIIGLVINDHSIPDTDRINLAIQSARKILPQLKKKEVAIVGKLALEEIGSERRIPSRVLHVVIDLAKSKMQDNQVKKMVKKPHKDILPFIVRYKNHGVGMIDMRSLLRKKKVCDALPPNLIKEEYPTVVYKLENTIRNQIFNYKKTAVDYKPGDENEMDCQCENSVYKDPNHGHIVTGDLKIIGSKKLQNLFKKGPNYREPKFINWTKTEEVMKEDLNVFVEKWSSKNRIPISCFQEWKNSVIQLLEEKVLRLKKCSKYVNRKSVIQECAEELEELKRRFVLVPVDKAANNIGFVCKKFYLDVIRRETQSDTYEEIEESVEEVIDYLRKESNLLGIQVDKEFNELPSIHATIKMHKDPIKFRYIIGSRLGVMKPAAKLLVDVLKLIMNTHRRYCDKIKLFTGIERNWIIDNNQGFLEDIERVNRRNAARNIKMCDFSTLYTGINQEDLKDKLKLTADTAFKGGTNQFIRVGRQARWYSGKGTTSDYVLDKERVYKLIDFVVDNSVFRLGNNVYRQKIGIPMGIDPAPQMANLYLYFYEAQYMKMMTEEDYGKAIKFNKTKRFIDDVGSINNDGLLVKDKERIYPKELVLNEENINDKRGTFLDLSITVDANKFVTKTYDKREDYNFEIVNYPDLSGNIPKDSAYGIFTSQILRNARVCSETADFLDRIRILTGKLIKKGYEKIRLKKTLGKCLHKYPWIKHKYENIKWSELL